MGIWLAYEFVCSIVIAALFIVSTSTLSISSWLIVGITAILALVMLIISRKRVTLKIQKQYSYYLLIMMIVFTICILLSKGFIGHRIWTVFAWLSICSAPTRLILELYQNFWISCLIPVVWIIITYLGMVYINHDYQIKHHLKTLVCATLSLVISFTVIYQRSQTVLPGHGFEYSGGYSSVNLTAYDVLTDNNKLAQLDQPSTFKISNPSKMPVLDGAEAAYPVYSALANAVYEDIKQVERHRLGLDNEIDDKAANKDSTEERIISFYNTAEGFERLVNGKVDLFFGAYPSESQLQYAASAGVELEFTPIGKEAFVFFVPVGQSIDNLSSEQLRGIYHGDYTNWSQFGGSSQKIMAFQRPERSGSQSMMKKFMGNISLKKPLKEEYQAAMSGVVENVAEYRNSAGAIGYSFRFFLMGMDANTQVKMLDIDGISPTAQSIQDNTYPIVVNLYCISVKNNPNENVSKMIDFILSNQGQEIVEKSGYVAL